MQEEPRRGTLLDWVISIVSLAAMILMLMYKPEFFWAVLPFPISYAVKALNMM